MSNMLKERCYTLSRERTQKSVDTLRHYSYSSENTNELARISIASIQVIETLLNDENIADKVTDAFNDAGLNEKADYIRRENP